MLNPHPHPLALLLRRPILLLDSSLEFTVRPVEQNLCALAGYQQTLHLAHRHTPVLLHCGILFIPQSLCWEEEKREKRLKQWCKTNSGLLFTAAACPLSTLLIAHSRPFVHCGLQFRGVNVNPIFLYIFPFC